MSYTRVGLGAVSAILAGFLVPTLLAIAPHLSHGRATGFAVVAGGVEEGLVSPLFWIIALVLFAFFLTAGRFTSKLLRIVLFWIPTVAILSFGSLIFSLIAYVWLHFRTG